MATLLAACTACWAADSAGRGGKKRTGPVAVVSRPVHDFGVLAPQQVSEHRFLLRNDGDEFLTIDKVTASCKCVLPDEVAEGVAPGETVEIPVSFKGKPTEERYAQSVVLQTNDPKNRRLLLRIVGRIAPDVVIVPDSLLMPRLEPDKGVSGRVDVVSSVWRDFRVLDVRTSSELIKATAASMKQETLDSWEATAGFSIQVDVDKQLVDEDFEQHVFLTVQPTDPPADPRTLKFSVVGQVRGRIMVAGRGMDHLGRMNLGAIKRSEGVTRRFVVKVRDAETDLRVEQIEVEPSYLEVSLEPYLRKKSKRLYRMEVTVPPGTLDRGYTGPNAGRLHLVFDHPRISDLDLRVEMLPAAPR